MRGKREEGVQDYLHGEVPSTEVREPQEARQEAPVATTGCGLERLNQVVQNKNRAGSGECAGKHSLDGRW